ncbi:MarR family winged helix-turn-helix transcriptional regulator [Arthrobacter sp. NA-172]|uniref:MarR family winged helix-turn-helix transcriptional regulator n=1 Tax=Arthrobacter sp. NA-172 TaxID=3367524 RepID=UPI003754CD7C
MAEDFGQRLPYLLRRVNAALSQRLDEDLREFKFTQSQLSALAILHIVHPDGLSGARLSARSGVTPQSMSAAIVGLAERGFVERSPHPTHGRVLECRITDAGADVLELVQRATRDSNRYDAGLSAAQQGQLRALLTEMMCALGLYLPSGEPHEPPHDGFS